MYDNCTTINSKSKNIFKKVLTIVVQCNQVKQRA
uniref:Uncharacterized protein n=1 Tax=Siphoviridae sp. ctRiO19 TaxID=2826337 RepID=A0A8S5LWV1_9CAUD|nr:MAG TPA: hypothetical protein [Siphoviridae sp. ctRiO19]DAX35446.1 MAG TPA: hypothetical protein [Caudoviricetes sp.]